MMIPGPMERLSQRRNGLFEQPRKRWTSTERNTAAEEPTVFLDGVVPGRQKPSIGRACTALIAFVL
jgi:hypothetical protein